MTLSTSAVAVCCCSIVDCGAQLVEQARVLDGDHGLVGETVDQLDLLIGEGPHLLAIDEMTPTSSSSFSMGTTRGCMRRRAWMVGSGRLIRHRRSCGEVSSFDFHTRSSAFGLRQKRIPLLQKIDMVCGVYSTATGEGVAIEREHRAELGFADPHSILQHGLEHGLEFAGRT